MDQGKCLFLPDCMDICENHDMIRSVCVQLYVNSCFNLHVVLEPCCSFCDSPLMFFQNFKNATSVPNLINPN